MKLLKPLLAWAVLVNRVWGDKLTLEESGLSIEEILERNYQKTKEC